MKEQCLIRADIYNNQPYFYFAKCLEEKRKDVDGEHRWELQLVDLLVSSPSLFTFIDYPGSYISVVKKSRCISQVRRS